MLRRYIIIVLVVSMFFLISCNKQSSIIVSDKSNIQETTMETLTKTASSNVIDNKSIEEMIEIIDGRSFITNYKVENDKLTMLYSNESLTKHSNLSQKDFDDYFLTGNKINKILIVVPCRFLRHFKELNVVDITILADKKYNIVINRKDVESFLGFSLSNITDDIWREKIINEYEYNENNQEKYFNKFKITN
jgi:hypothetical protein